MDDATWFVFGINAGIMATAAYVLFCCRVKRLHRRIGTWRETGFRGGPYDGGTSLPCSTDVRELRVEDGQRHVLHVYQRASGSAPFDFRETRPRT